MTRPNHSAVASRHLRAVIYARYSSENQREASIEDQLRVCRARAEREGWAVGEVFVDAAISGATAMRPGYQALLAALRAGRVDVVLAESLDRLSRDQEHVAALHKQASFAGTRIVTLAEGEVSELHVGLKGTMGALFLRDLADKTRRGLEGRVREGRSGGGLCYGYRVVRGPVGRDGEFERGLREIDPVQATVVQRIFRDYAAGLSPKRIAHALNEEGVPGPRGGAWSPSAINGARRQGTGILNNELYAGRLVWNRQRWLKDPVTGRRIARRNGAEALVTQEVPELRIVEAELWEAARRRQARLDRAGHEDGDVSGQPGVSHAFWRQQRPRFLLSGLMRCGSCGGGFSKMSARHFGCSVARNQGDTRCSNRLTIRQDVLEETVLTALRQRLLDPGLFAIFVAEFTAEWNRLAAEASAGQAGQREELAGVERQLSRLVDALADGAPVSTVRERMVTLERRRDDLRVALSEAPSPAPRLHPGLAEVYRRRVGELCAALERETGAETRETVRGLVEEVRLVPEEGVLRIEVRGALAAMLAVAQGAERKEGADLLVGALLEQIKMDAGTGFEPVTFRL